MIRNRIGLLKKISAITMITAIMIISATISVLARSSWSIGVDDNSALVPAIEIMFDENFSSFKEGTVVTKAVGTTAATKMGGSALNAKVVSSNGSNIITNSMLKMKAAGNYSGASSMYLESASTASAKLNGRFVTEFKFMQPEAGRITNIFAAQQLVAGGVTMNYPYVGINDSKKLTANGADTGFTVVNGVWYNVRVILDVEAQKYDLYLNGLPIAKEVAFSNGAAYTGDYEATEKALTRPFMAMGAVVDTFIDDIRIYREPDGRITYIANDFNNYTNDVIYSANNKSSFAGIGTAVVGTPKMKISASAKKIEMGPLSAIIPDQFTHLTKATVEFDFETTDAAADHGKIFRATHQIAHHEGAVIEMMNGLIYTTDDNGKKVILVENPKSNTNYHFKIYMDLSKTHDRVYNGKTISGNGFYDVYVNGVCRASGVEFRYNTAQESNITELGRIFQIQLLNTAPVCYIDNINIYNDERDIAMSEVSKAIFASCPDGYVMTDSLKPETTINGYSVNWSSSDLNIINPLTGFVASHDMMPQSVTLTATISDKNTGYSINSSFELAVSPLSVTEPITIKERTGTAVSNYHVRRSIPLEIGKVSVVDELCVSTTEQTIPSDTEVLERYSDGSIKWLLVSFSVDLAANEEKVLYVVAGTKKSGSLSYDEATKKIYNSTTAVSLSGDGIASIIHNGKTITTPGGIKLYAKVNGQIHYLSNAAVTILKNTDSYIKAQIRGVICDGLEGVIDVIVTDSDERIQLDYRITAKKNVNIQSTGLEVGTKHSYGAGRVIDSELIECNDLGIISYDNTRFKGAVSGSNTGFVIESGETVRVSPVVNAVNTLEAGTGKIVDYFTFYDGVSRTNHAYICFDNYAANLKTIKKPPQVKISIEQYVKAGLLSTSQVSVLAQETIDALKFAANSDVINGRFEAGVIPGSIDMGKGTLDGFYSHPGETEYNAGFGYMMSGDEDIFTLIQTSAETWADVFMYKGRHEQIVGANRTRSGEYYGVYPNFFTSHPYYGDPSGLYMAYILSGDEYLKESFLAGANHYARYNMLDNSGGRMPHIWRWSMDGSQTPVAGTLSETRYMIIARPLYLAYNLTGEAIYKSAAYDIANWATKMQEADGSWTQGYNDDGTSTRQSWQDTVKPQEQLPYKVYIMLYGYRGISDMMSWEYSEDMKLTLLEFADYLCNQNEEFGPGFWQPNGDVNVYEYNEDRTRYKSPMTDAMALEVLAKAYEIGKNERHLKNMLSVMEYYLSTSKNGLGFSGITPSEYGNGAVNIETNRCLTVLKSGSYLTDMINKNQVKVKNLGYESILVAFAEDAVKNDAIISSIKNGYPTMSQNVYKSGDKTYIFAHNNTDVPENDMVLNYVAETNSPYLWEDNPLWRGDGLKNVVNSTGNVTLKKHMEQFERVLATQRPIKISGISDNEACVEIIEYSENKIVMKASGMGNYSIDLENGDFVVSKGKLYTIAITDHKDESKTITVTSGSGTALEDTKIVVPLNFGMYDVVSKFDLESIDNLSGFVMSKGGAIENFPNIKDKSLKLNKGQTALRAVSSGFGAYVISQELCMRSAPTAKNRIMKLGDISIYIKDSKLYLNDETEAFADIIDGKWITLTIVVDNNGGCYDVYVDTTKKRSIKERLTENESLEYICNGGTININNAILGYYNSVSDGEKIIDTLLKALTQEELLALARVEALKKAKGEAEVFFDKLDEIEYALKSPYLSTESKNSYIEMIDKLETIAADEHRWLLFAENFENNSDNILLKTGETFSGAQILSTNQAYIMGEQDVLQLKYMSGSSHSRVIIDSGLVGDNYTAEFKFMQPVKGTNSILYSGAHRLGDDLAVKIQAKDKDILYFEGSEAHILIANYEANRWYKFKIFVDILTKTYDVYVDDVLKAENIGFSTIYASGFTGDNLSRIFRGESGSSNCNNLYDDIYIYSETSPAKRIWTTKGETSFIAKGNVAYESCIQGDKPYLINVICDSKGKLVKITKTSVANNNVLSAEISTEGLADGEYTLKAYLWQTITGAKPISQIHQEKFEILNGKIK